MISANIYQQDAVEWLKSLSAASVDLVVTDPAYESLEKHRAIGTTTRLKKRWFTIFPNSRFPSLFEELYRVLKKDTHLYMFCDSETSYIVKPIAEAVGFKYWKNLIWDKVDFGMGYHYRCTYEYIMFFEKGKRKLNNLGISDIIRCKRIRDAYPTEKPVSVCDVLIQQSSQPEDLVIDPFMGSAPVGEAALQSGRSFYGCDIGDDAIETASARLIPITASLSTSLYARSIVSKFSTAHPGPILTAIERRRAAR